MDALFKSDGKVEMTGQWNTARTCMNLKRGPLMTPGIRWKHYVGKTTQREPRKTELKYERSAYV
jgi:hypothetical protein